MRHGFHVGTEFSFTKCEILNWGTLYITYMELMPGPQTINTKCTITLYQNSTVLYR